MAGGLILSTSSGGSQYPGKFTAYVFFTCIVAATGGLIFGDIGISGGVTVAAIPGLIIFIRSLFLPETPNSLIERDQLDEAKRTLAKIRGTPEVDAEYDDLVAASEASKKVWKKLVLDRKYKPELC